MVWHCDRSAVRPRPYFCTTLLAALPSCTSANTGRRPEERMAASIRPPAPRRIPGDEPSIQRWFVKVGNAQVAFDDTLLRAEHGIAIHVSSVCRTLDRKIQTIVSALPSLRSISPPAGTQIADAIEPECKTFSKMADQCAASDCAGGRALLPIGVRQQADAQNTFDEILDGDENLGGDQ